MQRYKCLVSYDGTGFEGYQIQPNGRTVQGELERVLNKLHKGGPVKVSGSGRTDAGVHAKGQVIHFDSALSIPEEKWGMALNSLLPKDLTILKVEKADPEFHARFNAVGKEYRYQLLLSKSRSPFLRNYAYHYPYPLNLEAMEEGFNYLRGTHDFTSFCSAKTEVTDKIRTIREIDYFIKDNLLVLRFAGNGFLYNMVRILTGTLLEVGAGERKPEELAEILKGKDRRLAGKTAPPHGLYLWKVFYE
ncbi:tRNA pseudouridine(38-40) synthase TruA [Neobacillus terrae]|uniref:tRNA pseudouridine(38-40) synthase TruA n=1 Tax=Neobacillus terrae TaxID=3034837 RepID=UPI00140C47BC|nr:tRNA pseudouridine(38-40) synthase TruA [Neobacillus terrae]NHM33407.1 tRNA pseudouridine(38-40) synthase TruA [Neobacillus terrae]